MSEQDFDYEAAIERCAQADEAAFKSIYEREAPRMLALARRMLGTTGQAEEVVHDAFVLVWHQAGRFRRELGSGRAWLYSILRYRALNRLRSADHALRKDVPVGESEQDEPACEAPSPLEQLQASRENHALDRCIDKLDDPRKRPILMAFYQGFSHGQIANSLAIPLGTIKSRIRAGLRALQECMQA